MKYISNKDVSFLLELIKKLVTQFYSQNTPAKNQADPQLTP
ncbi:MAG: hypothetical protein N3D14_03900 [Aquificaceae bacterium]|nr:hypothetical protein [Aquificaceae bacterium]